MEKIDPKNYLAINKEIWNERTNIHFESEFYKNNAFIAGENSLNSIELEFLHDISGKRILHLQCHFGQDSISLSRMGAKVTGVDLSDESIKKAKELAEITKSDAEFICSDVYALPQVLDEKFDLVFTSYGTVGWLPDMDKWASVVAHFLKPAGKLIFAEFHPVVWMFDEGFKHVKYSYFNLEPIIEHSEGTYTNKKAAIKKASVSWNHSLTEVISALINSGLTLLNYREYDYSPYPCFNGVTEVSEGHYQIKNLEKKLPMVYLIEAVKN